MQSGGNRFVTDNSVASTFLHAREVVVRVRLKGGSTRLQAWFVHGSGHLGAQTWGVYYVSVLRLPDK